MRRHRHPEACRADDDLLAERDAALALLGRTLAPVLATAAARRVYDTIAAWDPRLVTPPFAETAAALLRLEAKAKAPAAPSLRRAAAALLRGEHRAVSSEAAEDARAMIESMGPPPRGRGRGPAAALAAARGELKALSEGGWSGAEPRHLVALYAHLHEEVYETPPAELTVGHAWHGAQSSAGKLLRDEFADDPAAAVEFMRWAWRRERDFEKKRRASGEDGRRIGWRLMFAMRNLTTDYRASMARARERGRR